MFALSLMGLHKHSLHNTIKYVVRALFIPKGAVILNRNNPEKTTCTPSAKRQILFLQKATDIRTIELFIIYIIKGEIIKMKLGIGVCTVRNAS